MKWPNLLAVARLLGAHVSSRSEAVFVGLGEQNQVGCLFGAGNRQAAFRSEMLSDLAGHGEAAAVLLRGALATQPDNTNTNIRDQIEMGKSQQEIQGKHAGWLTSPSPPCPGAPPRRCGSPASPSARRASCDPARPSEPEEHSRMRNLGISNHHRRGATRQSSIPISPILGSSSRQPGGQAMKQAPKANAQI